MRESCVFDPPSIELSFCALLRDTAFKYTVGTMCYAALYFKMYVIHCCTTGSFGKQSLFVHVNYLFKE